MNESQTESVESTPAPTTPPPPTVARYVQVCTTQSDSSPDRFANAIAIIHPSGALLIRQWDQPRSLPTRAYAPGAWYSFDHVGNFSLPTPRTARPQVTPAEQQERFDSRNNPRPGRTYEDQLSEIGSKSTAAPRPPRPTTREILDNARPRRFGWLGLR